MPTDMLDLDEANGMIFLIRGYPHRCELCGECIRNPNHEGVIIIDWNGHGYGECVPMPQYVGSDYFDEPRWRRVALVCSDAPGEERPEGWPRPFACPIPHALKMAIMWSKAAAFCDGYYTKAWESPNMQARWASAISGGIYSWIAYQRDITPGYAEIRARILNGDGFDETVGSGDYLRACRMALVFAEVFA